MNQPSRYTLGFALLALTMTAVFSSNTTLAQTITLYQNDFESPNVPPAIACGYAIDTRTINSLYGGQGGEFAQINTVETVLINEPAAFGTPQEYSDPEGKGGNYAIGMLSSLQNDRLALTFDGQGLPFVNVGMDISSIDVFSCGGPVGVAAPSYTIRLLDSPGGVFNWSDAVLDEVTIIGETAPDQWTFHWTNHVVALDASGSTDGNISIVWDLVQSGYGAFDNLIITSSDEEGDVTYSVGGTVADLSGSVTLQNNGGDDLTVNSNGSFTFSTELDDSASYNVSILTQPSGQTCSVSDGTGAIAGADVTNIVVNCVDDPVPTYSVGGNVSGLTGTGLALQNNGADTLAVAADGPFIFLTELIDTSTYAVTVSTQPTGQTCSVTNGSGTIATADVTNVAVTCVTDVVPTYSVGGTVSGLTGTGLALQNNGADTLAVETDGPFAFLTELTDTSSYAVTVSTQPTGQTCSVTNGSGTIATADVADVDVACVNDVVPPIPETPIPTLSQWALLILSMLLGLIVFSNRKRLF
jgi:hypothetical protein